MTSSQLSWTKGLLKTFEQDPRKVKGMVKHIYKNFLSDPEEYRLAIEYWQALCKFALRLSDSQEVWEPWLNTHFVNGKPFQDGNPIYSLISKGAKKGIRIIQEELNSNDIEIAAWLNTFGEDDADPNSNIQELVIVCTLSEETSKIASSLIQKWAIDETNLKEIKNMIDSLIE
jgi:hypothetical protein